MLSEPYFEAFSYKPEKKKKNIVNFFLSFFLFFLGGGGGGAAHAPTWICHYSPEKFDKSWDSSALKDLEQPSTVVGQIVKGACSTPRRLGVVAVGHCPDEGSNHLGWVHDGVAAGFLLRELVNHHGRLVHYNLESKIKSFRLAN